VRSAGLFGGTIADAALVLSELLSNAILHARPLPDERVRVAWMRSPAALEVLVSDGGGATRPHPAHPSLSSIGGRGLTIVEHLCSSWGVRAMSAVPPSGRYCLPPRQRGERGPGRRHGRPRRPGWAGRANGASRR
jgi:hypothetical protein